MKRPRTVEDWIGLVFFVGMALGVVKVLTGWP